MTQPSKMLPTSQEMAQRLEEAHTLHITRQIDFCAQLFPEHNCHNISLGHGVASFSRIEFGRKLNCINGYGMGGPVKEDDLAAVEGTFEARGVDTEISVCPLADPGAVQLLAERGYGVSKFLNMYVRILNDEDLKEVGLEGITVSIVPAERVQEFVPKVVEGYEDSGRDLLLFGTVARAAVAREDTSLYVAIVGGQIVASGVMSVLETSKGSVAYLSVDSTLPAYRGRGIQGALLRARLKDARKAGLEVAAVEATPVNNGSCRNIERAGFSLAYTKTWCSKVRK